MADSSRPWIASRITMYASQRGATNSAVDSNPSVMQSPPQTTRSAACALIDAAAFSNAFGVSHSVRVWISV